MCFIFTCIGRWIGVGGCLQDVYTDKDSKWLDSIVRKRYCTDVFFCVLLCAVLSVPVAFLYSSLASGVNLDYLLKGVDYKGRICDENNPDGSFGVLPDIRNFQVVTCVQDCEQTLNDTRFLWNYKTRSLVDRWCIPDLEWISQIGLLADDLWEEYSEHGLDAARTTQRMFMDVVEVKEVIGGCVLFAIIASFLYGYLIGYMGKFLVWLSIVLALIAGGLISAGLIVTSSYVAAYGFPKISTAVYVLGIICAILTGLMFIACLFLHRQINLAIELLKQTSLALNELKALFFIPLLTLLISVAYLAFWFLTLTYMLAVWDEKIDPMPGSPDSDDSGWLCPGPGVIVNGLNCMRPQDISWHMLECCSSVALDKPEKCCTSLYLTLNTATFTNLHLEDSTQYTLWCHFFILLWFLQFVIYWAYMIMCGAFAEWYFAKWKGTGYKVKVRSNEDGGMSHRPVCASCWRASRYHLGTIAFGSLIIAIIRFVQYVLLYMETQCSKDDAGAMTKLILRCVRCALHILQCIFDRVSKNGFIVCSITGLPFCVSSFKAIKLLMSNIMRTAALTMVSKYIEILGKLCIIALSTALCAIVLQQYHEAETTSILMPMAVTVVLSYLVANVYMDVFQVGIDTTFVCFLIDEQVNQTADKMRAHPRLIALFAKHEAKSMELGAAQSDRYMDRAQKERRQTFIAERNNFNQRMSMHMHGLAPTQTQNKNLLLAE